MQEDEHAAAFAEYYTPMLQRDRDAIEQCWRSMKAHPSWVEENLSGAPAARFAASLNGMELTCWMIADFEHCCTPHRSQTERLFIGIEAGERRS